MKLFLDVAATLGLLLTAMALLGPAPDLITRIVAAGVVAIKAVEFFLGAMEKWGER